ncbi:MAG: aminomethyl-transferring glycine dehydrogenase subunit GcvPB [Methanomassiliicoccaceae archaeon]|jgi:glycine dehydrogenase subunit 2|nr:aminomethyl-transferring glycine dehydrogenase subunit GcvPB [Methanomassiliicoccaceae archaeon]
MVVQSRAPTKLIIGTDSTKVGETHVPKELMREKLCLPNLPESEVVRHYTKLASMNFGVDNGPYPLGSCTMKYNPKYADRVSSLPKFTDVHPYQDESTIQGTLEMMWNMERKLAAIAGMDAVTLQPAAGAHGEHTAILMIKAYHEGRGEKRDEVIVPDSAHGTNPASAAMAGFKVIEISSAPDGSVDMDVLKAVVSSRTAAFMLTNPNTLGIFDKNVKGIAKIVHNAGALMYYDGANLNAIMGITTPGDMDFDIVHFNIHKTFAAPHGGGGPGSGPVGVKNKLIPFLPSPVIRKVNEKYVFDSSEKQSIGKMRAFYGNLNVVLRGYAYILRQGSDGLRDATVKAVMNSNYLKELIKDVYEIPYGDLKKHEFVASASCLKKEKGIKALDIAKRMIDHGIHPPTIYFPMLVDESMMFEPTEDCSMDDLKRMADVLITIANEDPEIVLNAPYNSSVSRVDETKAAKDAITSVRYMNKKGN